MFANKHLKTKQVGALKVCQAIQILSFFLISVGRTLLFYTTIYLCYSINKIGNQHTIKTQTNKDIYQRRQKPLNLNFQLFILQKK